MDVEAFIDEVNGQLLTVTGKDAGQCTAVPHKWERRLGLPIVYGDAADTFANAPAESYDRIGNAEDNFPLPGDIIVWGTTWGGGYGHTGVVRSADVNSFIAIEQNNPLGSAAHMVAHKNYAGVTGWLRPKVAQQQQSNQGTTDMTQDRPMTPEEETQAFQIVLGHPNTSYDGQTAMDFILHTQTELNEQRKAAQQKLDGLDAQLTEAQSASKQASDALAARETVITDLKTQVQQQQAQIDALHTGQPLPTPTSTDVPATSGVAITPGIKSTEFYATVAVIVSPFVYKYTHVAVTGDDLVTLAGYVTPILATAAAAWAYIRSRTKVKTAALRK
jgi:hypothetical protein